MKKLTAVLLILALLLPVAALASGGLVGPGKMFVYTENGKTLNVRSEPSTGDNVIGHLKYGEQVEVTQFLNGWCCIKWGDTYAYVQSRFLMWYKPDPKPTPKPEDPTKKEQEAKKKAELDSEVAISPITIQVKATRSSGTINIYKEPSKSARRVEACADEKELLAVAETNNWYRVEDLQTGKSGYIYKTHVTIIPAEPEPEQSESARIGKLDVNGEFTLQCKIPEGYSLQVISARGSKIIATLVSEDKTRPQMMLTVAFNEMYAGVDRMNDLSGEEMETLKKSFSDVNDVEFSDGETSHGTKLLIVREVGEDTDFVTFFSVYKGYCVEFVLSPNVDADDQTLTDAQIQTCIDFLSDLDFVPAN